MKFPGPLNLCLHKSFDVPTKRLEIGIRHARGLCPAGPPPGGVPPVGRFDSLRMPEHTLDRPWTWTLVRCPLTGNEVSCFSNQSAESIRSSFLRWLI